MNIVILLCAICLGIYVILRPDQAARIFCVGGMKIWRISTFGLTDMHWFYRESSARRIMRPVGVLLVSIFTILMIIEAGLFSGPNSFTVMNQAEDYLESVYGPQHSSQIRSIAISGEGVRPSYSIEYSYGGHSGKLLAEWGADKKFNFQPANAKDGKSGPRD